MSNNSKMKLNVKALQSMADNLISAETNPWQFNPKFLNNFTGNKRIRKKKARRFLSWAINEVVIPHMKKVIT